MFLCALRGEGAWPVRGVGAVGSSVGEPVSLRGVRRKLSAPAGRPETDMAMALRDPPNTGNSRTCWRVGETRNHSSSRGRVLPPLRRERVPPPWRQSVPFCFSTRSRIWTNIVLIGMAR